jgi:hypothetical protein
MRVRSGTAPGVQVLATAARTPPTAREHLDCDGVRQMRRGRPGEPRCGPPRPVSAGESSFNRIANSNSSHEAVSAHRSSARLKACACSGLSWSSRIVGTSLHPSSRAARSLPYPAIIREPWPIKIGMCNPKIAIHLASRRICSRLNACGSSGPIIKSPVHRQTTASDVPGIEAYLFAPPGMVKEVNTKPRRLSIQYCGIDTLLTQPRCSRSFAVWDLLSDSR